ncbi:mCG148072 [Mus musculus]|nr:mCG148072 [Mus musculus]
MLTMSNEASFGRETGDVNSQNRGAYYKEQSIKTARQKPPRRHAFLQPSPPNRPWGRSPALNKQTPVRYLQRRMTSHSLVSNDQPVCEVSLGSEARLQQGFERP